MSKVDQKLLSEIKEKFALHLEQNNQRKTPERIAILEEIYSRNDHFDAESLYIQMKNNNYNISRATVYNTLDLLVSCELVTKHQFGKNSSLYEKSYAYRQHDHIICTDTKEVLEFCDPRIESIKSALEDIYNVNIYRHSLNFYAERKKEKTKAGKKKKEINTQNT